MCNTPPWSRAPRWRNGRTAVLRSGPAPATRGASASNSPRLWASRKTGCAFSCLISAEASEANTPERRLRKRAAPPARGGTPWGVLVPDFGGGFGGKHTGEAATEAARLAREAGHPVAVRWTRAEEFMWAYFRPAALIET